MINTTNVADGKTGLNLNQTLLQLAGLQRPAVSDNVKQSPHTTPPPSYDKVVKSHNILEAIPSDSQLPTYAEVGGLSDAPPTYHSIFTNAVIGVFNPFASSDSGNSQSNQPQTLKQKIANVFIYGIIFFSVFIFILVLPLAMIVVGFKYMNKCPIQEKIPMYLIVLGFFQMLESFGRIGYKVFQPQNNQHLSALREKCRRKDPLIYIVIIWFVVGSMWVYQTNPACQDCNDVTPKSIFNLTEVRNLNVTTESAVITSKIQPKMYCDNVVYSFAFGVITVYYGVIGFFCFLVFLDVFIRAIRKCCCTRHIV